MVAVSCGQRRDVIIGGMAAVWLTTVRLAGGKPSSTNARTPCNHRTGFQPRHDAHREVRSAHGDSLLGQVFPDDPESRGACVAQLLAARLAYFLPISCFASAGQPDVSYLA